jgi:hypothetical protein
MAAMQARRLRQNYGDHPAVDGIDLSSRPAT